jgi:dTDP-4-amino-4,6-dideoxygalactose transaminase
MAGTATSPDIPLFDLRLAQEDLDAVADVLRSGRLALGERTHAFEEAFAAQLGVRHAVALSSCTAALHLAYLAAGVGPGDEVIVPAMTFAATATAVLYCGATPVFAEIAGQHDLSLDPDDVAARVTPRTKAVSVVHFGGYAAQVDRLRSLCDAHGLALVEDAAHAPSGRLGDRKLGTFGLAGCFSLFSNKVLSVGEGGLLTTDDDAVAAFARSRRSHAVVPEADGSGGYDVDGLGFNYRFDEPRAALALSRLDRLEADIAQRQALTRRYRERLAGVPGVTVPYRDEDVAGSSCYVMPIMVEDPQRQNPLRAALREHRVQTSLLYPAIHEFTAYRERFPGISLPRTELASRTEVTIPLFPHMTEAEQDRVVGGIAEEMGA